MLRIASVLVALGALCAVPPAAGALTEPTITEPQNDAIVRAIYPERVRVAGTATPGATIDVWETSGARGVIATATPDASGTWSAYVPFPGGEHTIYALPRDGSGAPSSSVTFDVDAMKPNTPRIDRPADNTIFKPGEPPRLEGRAADDHGVLAVQVEYYLLNKMVLRKNMECDGCAGATSVTWRDAPGLTTPGYYVAKVVTYDVAGTRSDVSQVSFFTSGIHSLPVQQPDPSKLPKPPVIETPDPNELIPGAGSPPNGTPIDIGGVTQPGNTVKVYEEEDGWIGQTVGDRQTGRWSIRVRFTGGTYGVWAYAVDSRGRRSRPSVKVTFAIDDVRPVLTLETETDPIVFLPTQRVTLAGTTGDDRSVVAVNLEYWYGDKLMLVENASCPQCDSGNATWTDNPALQYPGYYFVYVRAIDAAGNRSLTDSIRFVKSA